MRESAEPADAEDLRRLEQYKLQARQYVSTYVTLMDENCLDSEITQTLRSSAAGRAQGDAGQRTHVLVYYSAQDAGEASSQPWCRVPPLRERGGHLERFVRLILQRFPSYQEELHPQDVYIVNDSGRAGNRSAILKAFTLPSNDPESKSTIQLKKTIKSVSLLLSEASLAQNKAKIRGQAIEQVQSLLQISKTTPELNLHDRLHVQHATNRGNAIGFMSSESWDTSPHVWRVQQKIKLEMLGKHGAKVPVGGGLKKKEAADDEAEGDDEEGELNTPAPPPPTKNDLVPFLHHTVPYEVFEELLHAYDCVAAVGMAADGKLAKACLARRIPFFGLAFSESHAHNLMLRLEKQCFEMMADPASKMHIPVLSKLLMREGGEGDDEGEAAETGEQNPRRKGLGKKGQSKKGGAEKGAGRGGGRSGKGQKGKKGEGPASPKRPGFGTGIFTKGQKGGGQKGGGKKAGGKKGGGKKSGKKGGRGTADTDAGSAAGAIEDMLRMIAEDAAQGGDDGDLPDEY